MFCRYCLQSFTTKQITQKHVNGCFEVNSKLMIKMAKQGKNVKFRNHTKNIKSPFMIYAPKVYYFRTQKNGRQNGNQSYTKKYQIHVSCSFVYKLVYVDDQFCKPFK